MNAKQLRSLGIVLGLVLVALVTVRFSYSLKTSNVNWYYLVMVCGMALLLFYTLVKPKNRRR